MGKVAVSDKCVLVSFNANQEPQFKFKGAWDIRDLGRVRSTLFRAYKHYIREIRMQNKEDLK